MSASEDESDVAKVLQGDLSAFEGIVRRWQGPLINVAYRFCRDRSRAEEMAQVAFLRVYRALGKWRRESAFSTWLFALAINVYRTELRRFPPLPASFAHFEAAKAKTEEHESDHEVRRAVLTLPPKYREPVLLFYFHEMDIAAVGSSLTLPEGTVKARLFRAREMLRSKLTSRKRTHE